ncbi:MAG: CARDB domain-containing protein [Ignavibacteria bacterium]|nr:CARDB domain-containing protein [Ignavibacteria bacterium]
MKIIFRISIYLSVFVVLNTNIISQPKDVYDIKATYVKYSPENITLNNPVEFTYRIENCGEQEVPAKSYDVEFYVDNKLINWDYATPKLKLINGIVDYSTEGDSRYAPKKLGKHTYKLVVDPKNRLKETDKANNVIEGVFVVKK